MKSFVLLFLFLILFPFTLSDSRIKHVVALMFENRSFDHLLGHLKKINPKIDGLTGKEFNLKDPFNPKSQKIYVNFDAEPYIGVNPDHSVPGTQHELFGKIPNSFYQAPMNGFVSANHEHAKVMSTYNISTVPAASQLALNFALFDKFYSSVPGPTDVNRGYFLSGTSYGHCINPTAGGWVDGYFPQETIFNQLYDENIPFKIYFSDFPMALEFDQVKDLGLHVHTIDDFYDNAKSGNLPSFSYIEPRWFDLLEWKENDQHPPHSITYGEYLLKDVYDALRNSPQWNETLLYISYDEHGGLYDHVAPPFKDIPNPDGKRCDEQETSFDFNLLGVRVPTIVASPWVDAQIVGEPSRAHFDHTSMFATVKKIFNMTSPPLTKRMAWSATFENILRPESQGPRTDCPQTLQITEPEQYQAYRAAENLPKTDENLAMMLQKNPLHPTLSPVINELQRDVALIAWALGDEKPFNPNMTVYEAAMYVRNQMKEFKSRPFKH